MPRDGLIKCELNQSDADPCLFYKNDTIIVTFVDGWIMLAKDHDKVKQIIKPLEETFKFTDGGDLSTELGIGIAENNNGSWTLSLTFLIEIIIKVLTLENNYKACYMPSNEILTSYKKGIQLLKLELYVRTRVLNYIS